VSAAVAAQVGESLGALRGVFANRQIRNVQLAFAGAVTATYGYSIAIAVYAYQHDGVTAVGVLGFVRLATAAAIAPLAASLADRHRRERVMLASDVARFATVGAAAIVAALAWPAMVVYALAVVATVAGTVFRPAEAALLPTIARSPDELTAANVSSSTIDSVGSFVGPALGAFLLAVQGPTVVFAVTAAAYAWSAAFIARVQAPATETASPEDAAKSDEGGHDLLAGLRAIRHEPRLRLLIGLYGAQTMVAGALGVLVVVTALSLLGLGSAGVGLLEAASGVGSIVGAGVMLALVARRQLGRDLALGIFLWGAPLVLVGLLTNTAVAIAAWFLVGLGNTLVDIAAITLLQRAVQPSIAARVFGVLESMLVAGLALGALLAPLLVHTIGARAALMATGGLLPILALLTWGKLRTVDAGARVDPDVIAAFRSVPFLAPLPLHTLEYLGGQASPVHLENGEVLFRRGEGGDRFYLLRQGAIEIDLDQAVKREDAPAYVGEIALLRDVPRTATVRAVEACELYAVERDDFLSAVVRHSASRGIAQDVVATRIDLAPSTMG
jgi:MFS family permease